MPTADKGKATEDFSKTSLGACPFTLMRFWPMGNSGAKRTTVWRMSEKVLPSAAAHARRCLSRYERTRGPIPVFGTMLSGGIETRCNFGSFFEKTLILWTCKRGSMTV